MAAVKYMAAGWAFFTGTHFVMSHPPVRDALISGLGSEDKFRGLYSLVAASAFLPTTYIYIRYGRGQGNITGWTDLTRTNPAVRGLGLASKLAAGITFGQGLATPAPAEKALMKGENTTADADAVEPKGIFRITRHPMFTSLALLGLGNILLRGYAGDVVYWGGWVVNWAVGCPHQDYRLAQKDLMPPEYWEKTSFLPFAAIAAGRNSFAEAFKEFNKPAMVTAIAVPIFFL